MVARFAGAGLGCLAFTVTILAGLFVHNPVEVILSRSILALFAFCFLGLLLGSIAQRVVGEHEKERLAEIEEQFRVHPAVMEDGASDDETEPEVVYPDGA